MKYLFIVLYNIFLPIILILGFPLFLIKGIKRGDFFKSISHRFGFISIDNLKSKKRPIWIHAVSVGEISIAIKLIRKIHKLNPNQYIVLSTTTTTGYVLANKYKSDSINVIYNPVDLYLIVKNVIKLINPKIFILIESEIWPNLIFQLSNKCIPVKIVNARLSDRSYRRYVKFKPFIYSIISQIDSISVPFSCDVQKWVDIGVNKDKIKVLGNIKFDQESFSYPHSFTINEVSKWLTRTGALSKDNNIKNRIILLGSSHKGEEVFISKQIEKLYKEFDNISFIAVPRHAERGVELASEFYNLGWNVILRNPSKNNFSNNSSKTIWIINSTGELQSFYELSDIVIIGKSFLLRGGQNPAESVFAKKFTIVGPYMENFSTIVENLLNNNSIIKIGENLNLEFELRKLLKNPERYQYMIKNSIDVMSFHKGSTSKNVDFILS